MRIAVDSNRYTDFAKGDEHAVSVFHGAQSICLPLIVLAELRAGFSVGTQKEKNERILTQFLNTEGVSVVCPDENTSYFYAEIFRDLRKRGKPIPTNDIWIAAIALQLHLVLFDRDSHFDLIPQLARAK